MFEKEIQRYEVVRNEYEAQIKARMTPADYMDWHEVLFSTHSCGIEGNSFTVDDTRILKEQGLAMVPVGHSLLECTEMADHFRAFQYVTSHLDAPFDEQLLRETNRLVTEHTLAYRVPGAIPGEYTHDKAYEMFAKANKLLEEQGGREVKGYMLDVFFRISYAKYQADNNGFREQFLQDYLDSKDLCEKMLQLAKEESDPEKAKKIVDEYDQPLNNIEGIFAQSKAADREQIIAIFTPKIEANKDNLAYLKSALTLMAANDCDDAPVYYKAAEYAFKIEPTFESAIALAQKYYKDGNHSEAITYYNRAIELSQSDVQKGNIALRVAAAMRKSGDTQSAYTYLDKAAQLNPDLEGKCYMQRANIATKEKKYAEAKAYCDKAAAADITLAGQAQRLKQSIITVEQHNAEYARQKAEYDRQQAEIKAEEDFWKQGAKK